ncbi:hypothetical protein Taro_012840 [Colocasia esculenta]|uniref:Uncharacterized protein n=1 Tax=Colocasia esculenta TaxID=4460 RepID=A0A843U9X3_COLES|nr:hypothetical protein [Colocasia esculenta]
MREETTGGGGLGGAGWVGVGQTAQTVLSVQTRSLLKEGSAGVGPSRGQVVPSGHARAQATPGQFGEAINSYSRGGDPEKRRHDGHISESESSKKQALDGRTAVGVGNHNGIQTGGDVGLQRKQEIMIMVRKNKNLRSECLDYEKAVKELSLKVEKLRSEIEGVRRRHDELEVDYRSIVAETKSEKH